MKPKQIQPGWGRRWTRQSIALFRRAPGLAILMMMLFGLCNSFVPQPLALNVPATVFLVGLLFSSLRAADRDCGNAWSATWLYFRQTARDLALLARDAFLIMLVFGFLVALFLATYAAATHGIEHITPSMGYQKLPSWIKGGIFRASNMLTLGIFLPGVVPLIFLTMSVGNQSLMHFVTGYNAAVLNMRVTYSVSFVGLLACNLLPSLLRQMPKLWLGYLLLLGFAAAFWWFGAWGYLWCREMFEGTEENAKETAKQRSGKRAVVSAGAHLALAKNRS